MQDARTLLTCWFAKRCKTASASSGAACAGTSTARRAMLRALLTRWPGGAQDAQEFLNYLLNECSELLEKEVKAAGAPQPAWTAAAYANGAPAALNGYAAPAGAASAVARGAAEGATQAVQENLVLSLLPVGVELSSAACQQHS